MACTNNYIKICLSPQQREMVENELYGAKQLYINLCNNTFFRNGKLSHNIKYLINGFFFSSSGDKPEHYSFFLNI